MLFLVTNNVNGNIDQYRELANIVKVIHPTFTVILGDVLSKNQSGKQSQLFSNINPYLDKIQITSPILLQFGGYDLQTTEDYFDANIQTDKIINLSKNTITYEGLSINGINQIPDHPFNLKDWSRRDGKSIEFSGQIETPLLSQETGFKEIDNLEEHLKELPSLGDILVSKISTISDISKSIWFTLATPTGLKFDHANRSSFFDSYDIRQLAEGNLTEGVQPLSVISGFPGRIKEASKMYHHQLGKCSCFQISRFFTGLDFILIDISDFKITKYYHSKHIEFDRIGEQR